LRNYKPTFTGSPSETMNDYYKIRSGTCNKVFHNNNLLFGYRIGNENNPTVFIHVYRDRLYVACSKSLLIYIALPIAFLYYLVCNYF
jgi:hypothetical protein